MKAITIQFLDATDLSALAIGKVVTVTADSTTISGGTVVVIATVQEQPLTNHKHPITATGTIIGETGTPMVG